MDKLLWVWQLPQNILGYFLTRKYDVISTRSVSVDKRRTVYFKTFFCNGLSLGDYIILDRWHLGKCGTKTINTICHEYGHQRQSLILGWLYIPLIIIPSALRSLWNFLFHRSWSKELRDRWYYRGYPERWADVLGDVIRD